MEKLAKKLSLIDELETWTDHVNGYEKKEIANAYKLAVPMWVERMIKLGKLLIHPDVAKNLETQNWHPDDLQKRMIWASILGSDESPRRKERMYLIKDKLIKRYGRDWWEDVFKRKNDVYAARERIKKNLGGAAMSMFITNTHLGAICASDERLRALRMIPKN